MGDRAFPDLPGSEAAEVEALDVVARAAGREPEPVAGHPLLAASTSFRARSGTICRPAWVP